MVLQRVKIISVESRKLVLFPQITRKYRNNEVVKKGPSRAFLILPDGPFFYYLKNPVKCAAECNYK